MQEPAFCCFPTLDVELELTYLLFDFTFIYSKLQLELVQPVCTRLGACVTLSRRVDKRWRLIGWAKVHSGTELQPGTAMSLDVVQTSKGAYAKSPAPLEHVAKIATMMQFKG